MPIPTLMTNEELFRGIDLLGQAISSERKQKGVVIPHAHGSGSEPVISVYQRAQSNGFREVSDYGEFSSSMFTEPGNLESYLKASHFVDETQAGLIAFKDAMDSAVLNLVSTEGTVPVIPGNYGSAEDPIFRVSHVFIRFNPMKRTGRTFKGNDTLVDVDLIIAEVDAIARRYSITHRGVKVGVILCFARELNPEINEKMANKVLGWTEKYSSIVGVDIAGPENNHGMLIYNQQEPFLPRLFKESAGEKLVRTIHCGETEHVDLGTFCASIRAYEPHQVAHPIIAWKAYREGKKSGMEILKEREIIVELCPWSNMVTGAIKSAKEFGQMLCDFDENGIRYVIGTDNPALQRTTLALELAWLLVHNAISAEQIEKSFKTGDECEFVKRLKG